MGPIRTFVCLRIPELARDPLVAVQERLKLSGAHVSWVKPNNIHLTIKFLGDVQPDRLEEISRRVSRAAGPVSPIDLQLTEVGCFPTTGNPRVIWVGPTHLPEALRILHHRVEQELVSTGFSRDSRPFAPHFTLGRVRSGGSIGKLADAVAAEELQPLCLCLTEVTIMGSKLHPRGALYTPIDNVPLGSTTPGG